MAKSFVAGVFMGTNVPVAYKRLEEIKMFDPSSGAYVAEDPTGMFAVIVGTRRDASISREIMEQKLILARAEQ